MGMQISNINRGPLDPRVLTRLLLFPLVLDSPLALAPLIVCGSAARSLHNRDIRDAIHSKVLLTSLFLAITPK